MVQKKSNVLILASKISVICFHQVFLDSDNKLAFLVVARGKWNSYEKHSLFN